MINNEIKQLVREMKIETVADFGTFQELESIAAELLNSNDTSNKLLAMRIQNRLNENPNYQIFTQRQKIEQEVATEKQEKEILDKKQEIRHSNAAANLETKKKEEAKVNESKQKEIEYNFKKMTEIQQKFYLEAEKHFAPELRDDFRKFALTSGTTEEKTKELTSIIGKQVGEEIKISDNGVVYFNVDMDKVIKDPKQYQETFDKLEESFNISKTALTTAVVNGNPEQAGAALRNGVGSATQQAKISTEQKADKIDEKYSPEIEKINEDAKTLKMEQNLLYQRLGKGQEIPTSEIQALSDEQEKLKEQKERAQENIDYHKARAEREELATLIKKCDKLKQQLDNPNSGLNKQERADVEKQYNEAVKKAHDHHNFTYMDKHFKDDPDPKKSKLDFFIKGTAENLTPEQQKEYLVQTGQATEAEAEKAVNENRKKIMEENEAAKKYKADYEAEVKAKQEQEQKAKEEAKTEKEAVKPEPKPEQKADIEKTEVKASSSPSTGSEPEKKVETEKQEQKTETSKKDDNAEKAKEAKANVEVYNPSVRAQREKEGTAAETQKEVRETYGGSDSDSPVVVVKQENQQTETQTQSQTTAPATGN